MMMFVFGEEGEFLVVVAVCWFCFCYLVVAVVLCFVAAVCVLFGVCMCWTHVVVIAGCCLLVWLALFLYCCYS